MISSLCGTSILFFIEQTQQKVTHHFDQNHLNHIYIYHTHHSEHLWDDYLNELAAIQNIQTISLIKHRRITVDHEAYHVMSMSTPVFDSLIYSGRALHPNDRMPFTHLYSPKHSQSHTDFAINHMTLELVGESDFVSRPMFIYQNESVLEVSDQTFDRLFGNQLHNTIVLEATNQESIHHINLQLKQLHQQYMSCFHAHTLTASQLLQAKKTTVQAMQHLGYGIMALLILLTSITLININQALYLKRRSEIALRLAIGATTHDIYMMLMKESSLNTLTSFTLSTPLMYLSTMSLSHIQNFAHHFSYTTLLQSFILMLLLTLLSSLLPARQSFSIPIAQILKGA
jgi:hypothetical protein